MTIILCRAEGISTSQSTNYTTLISLTRSNLQFFSLPRGNPGKTAKRHGGDVFAWRRSWELGICMVNGRLFSKAPRIQ